MNNIVDFPLLVFLSSFITLWISSLIGAFFRKRLGPMDKEEQEDFTIVEGAALTLLSLLIGFTFSMAINRYEQRKNYEEAEANAIGTEYVRAGLLPATEEANVQDLLRKYLDQRVLFYTTRDKQLLQQIDTNTERLQNELWSVVQASSSAQPTPPMALAVSGMNDVLNSQGYTQAAWWNRIPFGAWLLLALVAIGCNVLLGYGVHRPLQPFVDSLTASGIAFVLSHSRY